MNNYSGYLLCSGSGANSDFSAVSIKLQPGAPFSYPQESDKNILLAGGFPAIHPDSSFPLSPTLQLNGDLTDMDETALTALARAEFIRESSQSYRSYTLESDARVTVLGADEGSLSTFVDTYGGVLEIDPILLQGYHPEMTTAQELKIEKVDAGFQLNFSVKQPIDLNRCTYCGACGPSCPEHCISEQLFLDFSQCTFCKECVSACSQEAIDLYAVERRELMTPALLLLDGATADLPESSEHIYSESTLPALFESVYSTEIEEVIGWDSTYCQYSARLGIGCTACVSACHHSAIQQGKDGVRIDHLACVECGACLGSCPTGALQYKRFDDIRFVEYFRTFPFVPGTTVVLGDEDALHKYWWQHSTGEKLKDVIFMEYPTPAALHGMHFLFLYAMGAKEIFVLGEEDGSGGLQMLLTNALLQDLFQKVNPVRLIDPDGLADALQENEKSSGLTTFYHDFSYTNRREKLIALLQFLRHQSHAEPATLTGAASKDFGEIICNEEKCTQCVACVSECRVESLVADSDSYTLKQTPAQCVQCGICVVVCPENALTMKPGLSLREDFFKERVMAQAEPAKCKGCGKIFGTRKSLEKVVAILSAKNMWDEQDDLLSFCDECRVVNLYTSAEK